MSEFDFIYRKIFALNWIFLLAHCLKLNLSFSFISSLFPIINLILFLRVFVFFLSPFNCHLFLSTIWLPIYLLVYWAIYVATSPLFCLVFLSSFCNLAFPLLFYLKKLFGNLAVSVFFIWLILNFFFVLTACLLICFYFQLLFWCPWNVSSFS